MDTSQFTAPGLIGAAIAPGEFVRIMGVDEIEEVGVVANFNSTTGEITLAAPLFDTPFPGAICERRRGAGHNREIEPRFQPRTVGERYQARSSAVKTRYRSSATSIRPWWQAAQVRAQADSASIEASAIGSIIKAHSTVAETLMVDEASPETTRQAGSVDGCRIPGSQGRGAFSSCVDRGSGCRRGSCGLAARSAQSRCGAGDSEPAWTFEKDTEGWPPADDVPHDLALEVAWDELG